jgi:ParB-like chromosome segregation protein Spo0J
MKPREIKVSDNSSMSGNGDFVPRFSIQKNSISVQAIAISQIKPNSRNSRTHSARQIRQIADSIVAFGFTNPLLVSEDSELIAGHGRYGAAKLLGLAEVPVIVVAGLSPAKRRALAIADNSRH